MYMLLALSLLGQTATPSSAGSSTPSSRLDFMKKSVAAQNLQLAGDPNVVYRLQDAPALRFTNSVGTVTDGAVFFWLDRDDRPVGAVQVYRTTAGSWHQAFSSLSTAPLRLGSVWAPARAGVRFNPVPGAPRPADTPERRLRQMAELRDGFKAEMQLELKTWYQLRSLSKPLLRYGAARSPVRDGGVFAFVLTTDPEVYLLLEARDAGTGLEWQYAFAPEASAPIRGSWKGQEVWTFAFDAGDNAPQASYYDWGFSEER